MLTAIKEEIESERISRTGEPWLNLCAHLDPRYGGISAVLPSFCEAIDRIGVASTTLVAFCAPDEAYEVAPDLHTDRFPLGLKRWLLDSNLRGRLESLVERSAGVHIHGLWQEHCLFGTSIARKRDKPYILSAHGMLDPWALRNKRYKKWIYGCVVERSNLQDASCLHALTEQEANDYRRYGSTAPIAVIPNGVQVPGMADPEAFLEDHPELRGKELVLFLGRIHFKKGLEILCRSWRDCQRSRDAHLVLAGPDFEGTRSKVEALVDELGIRSSVTFTGMLKGEKKWGALKAAALFVLPSYSEGLSVSVIEAMGMGLPVIITRQCNVPEVASAGCGWTIEPFVEPLTESLNEFFTTTMSERNRLGSHGRKVVETTYNWRQVGRQISAVYQWLESGRKPVDVDLRVE